MFRLRIRELGSLASQVAAEERRSTSYEDFLGCEMIKSSTQEQEHRPCRCNGSFQERTTPPRELLLQSLGLRSPNQVRSGVTPVTIGPSMGTRGALARGRARYTDKPQTPARKRKLWLDNYARETASPSPYPASSPLRTPRQEVVFVRDADDLITITYPRVPAMLLTIEHSTQTTHSPSPHTNAQPMGTANVE